MIWLFANRSYGGPYVEAASRLVSEGGFELTRVISERDPRRRGKLNALRRGIRADLTRRRREREHAADTGLPTAMVADVNAPEFIERVGPRDHGVIAGFNQIFRVPVIERFASLVNFHPSLLPFYRGPTPSHWCLENAEASSGYTLHEVTPEIDHGAILHQGSVPTDGVSTSSELNARIAARGASVLELWLIHLTTGAEFTRTTVDAAAVYREHVDYRSSPPPGTKR